jgi:transcriptional regulator with XRE-family HTH domain
MPGRTDNSPMSKDGNGGVGRPLAEVLAQVARDHGVEHPPGGKNAGKVNAAKLARLLKMNQPTITRILNGEIRSPSPALLRALRDVFSVTLDELLDVQAAPPHLSPEAARIAAAWDALPPALRGYLKSQIEGYHRFAQDNEALAALLFSPPSRADYSEIVRWQAKNQRRKSPG